MMNDYVEPPTNTENVYMNQQHPRPSNAQQHTVPLYCLLLGLYPVKRLRGR